MASLSQPAGQCCPQPQKAPTLEGPPMPLPHFLSLRSPITLGLGIFIQGCLSPSIHAQSESYIIYFYVYGYAVAVQMVVNLLYVVVEN